MTEETNIILSNIIKQNINEICLNCLHFNTSYDILKGECICVMSKNYKDIMTAQDKCYYFHKKERK
jgi:hypothetical protein